MPILDTESLHFNDYWRVIRARIWIILILPLLTISTGYIVAEYLMPKIYGGTADLRILKQGQKSINVFDGRDGGYFDPTFFESETKMLESKEILYPVIESLGLQKSWSQRYMPGGQLRQDEVFEILRHGHLQISPERGTNVIHITGLSEDMQEGPRLANAIANAYIHLRSDQEQEEVKQALQTVEDEIKKKEEIVRNAKQKIEDLRKELNIDVTGFLGNQGESQLTTQELQHKQAMLDEQRADTEQRRVRYDHLKTLDDEQLIATLPALGLSDPNIDQIHQQKLQAESNLQSLLHDGYGPEHTRITSLQAGLKTLTEQLKTLTEGRRTALLIDLNVSQGKLDLLQKDVDALRIEVRSDRSVKIAPYQDAVKTVETEEQALNILKLRYEQESVEKGIKGIPASVITAAEPNPSPVSPKKILILLLSGLFGTILGLAVAFFIEYLDTSVKTLHDVEKTLGTPVLAIIPQGAKPLNQDKEDSPHAEGYRILRARIDLQAGNNQGNAFTMLSGGPGEGKSTTLFNLGFVCAQSGQTVIIVDADLRRPSLHKTLGIELTANRGLSDYLENGGSIVDYIVATPIPNLHVILAGTRPNEAKSLFNNKAVRQILDELKAMYQVVLIDSPPALGVSDASVIAHEVDKTILVIQHRRYPRDVSLRAKQAIEEVQGNLVGVVLNAVALHTQEGYYYYGAYSDYYGKSKNSKGKGKGKVKSKQSENQSEPIPAIPRPPPTGSNEF